MRNSSVCRQRGHTGRSGVTLIELVVVIAIVGMLVSLLLPALMSSREVARASTCRSRLKQIGLALHNYEGTHRSFPPLTIGLTVTAGGGFAAQDFSAYGRLLPYINQSPVYRRINWSSSGTTLKALFSGELPRLAELTCPSDPNLGPTSASFAFSMGATPEPYPPWDPIPESLKRLVGAFEAGPSCLRTSDFRDGLSNTVGMSEIRNGSEGAYDSTRDVALNGAWGATVASLFPANWIGFCGSVSPPVSNFYSERGRVWLIYKGLLYDHILPPNPQLIDCAWQADRGLLSARSYHIGEVHGLVMDGSARSFSNNISTPVWWAVGTRMGAETSSLDF